MAQVEWAWLIASYFFLGGLAGGAYLTGVAADLFGKGRLKLLAKSGAYAAPIPLLVGMVFLILDLGKPASASSGLLHVLNIFLHPETSLISIGTIILVIFGAITILTAILWFAGAGSRIRLPIGAVGSVFAFGTVMYAGLLLAVSFGRPLWLSPLLPWLFTISALLTGLAATGLFIPIFGYITPTYVFPEYKEAKREELTHVLGKAFSVVAALIVIEIIVELAEGSMAFLRAPAEIGILLTGPLSGMFWVLYVLIGLLLPLAAWLLAKFAILPKTLLTFSVVFILVLIGGFFLRYVVLIAGQL